MYGYVGGNPINFIDPYGLWAWGDPLPTGVVNGVTGFGDAAGLMIPRGIRGASGIDGGVDPCSPEYRAGSVVASVVGGARLAYAGLAKFGAARAESGVAASAFRSNLRTWFGGGKTFRPPNVSKYETDTALKAAAGRTNLPANAWGAGAAAAGATGASGCDCAD